MQHPLTSHEHAAALASEISALPDLNEADTRHRIIDTILHDVLSWPRSSTRCEEYITPGYADYVLLGRADRRVLLIEAKRAGHTFQLPHPSDAPEYSRFEVVKTLLTDETVSKVLSQVRTYCVDTGCEFAAITNGTQWIFFRTFVRNKDWRQLTAFVITDIRFFDAAYTKARQYFSYRSITSDASLSDLLGDPIADRRPRFFPKERITGYNHEVTSNHLAPVMRPLIERYFGRMDPHDSEFMDRCYVNHREYQTSEANVKQLIHDSLSPYFRDYKVSDFFEDTEGGQLGARIASSARERRTRDVIVLFGGKGAGKSTFINRLLFHRPPNAIRHFTRVAVIDLLECPESKHQVDSYTWRTLIAALDTDNILTGNRDGLLELFADRHEVALRQSLAGLSPDSETFNIRLNELVDTWKDDHTYCAHQLANYWKHRKQGVVVVLDNTDQFSPETQDYCFTLAHRISTELDCLVVISMREERFYYSKIHGTLDAFHNSGFHLASPKPERVFQLRLSYLLRILTDPSRVRTIAPEITDTEIDNLTSIVRVFLREFKSSHSHLSRFVKACAHGNMRLALEFFREFVLSGYTRVDEMISRPSWTLQVHQVIRPMMVPYRLFYDEPKSAIPNVFQVRSEVNGSHFTGIRILDMLATNMDLSNPEYIPLSQVRAYFADRFNMLDDAERCLDVFLRSGVVEANNRIDEFDEAIDSIKITAYGIHVLRELSHSFSYLDLICLDCGIHDQGVAETLSELGNRDRDLFLSFQKRERLSARIQKVRSFLDYLASEERIEREVFSLESTDRVLMPTIREMYDEDEEKVRKSASNIS